MTARSLAHPAYALAAALATTLAVPTAQAADFSDTYIGYRHGTTYREPNNGLNIEKNIVQLTHVSNHKYGSNFINVDTFVSDSGDRANNSTQGAHEIYVVYRTQLSLGKTLDLPTKVGPLRDVAIQAGFDLNSKDTTFAPRKRAWVLGPTFKFDVPGFLDVSAFYYSESNHRGIPGTLRPDVGFDGTYQISASWGVPFSVASVPLKFQGVLNYTGTKGLDYQNIQTERETLMRTALMVDVGQLAFDKKNTVWAGVGYEFWNNKFGNPPGVGTRVNAVQTQLEVHF